MRVIKRSGRIEDMKFDNVTNRIKNLTYGLSEKCDSSKVAQQVFSSMYDNITAQEIDTPLRWNLCWYDHFRTRLRGSRHPYYRE